MTGKPLFIAPRNRTFEEFKDELVNFGRPIFRDDEVSFMMKSLPLQALYLDNLY